MNKNFLLVVAIIAICAYLLTSSLLKFSNTSREIEVVDAFNKAMITDYFSSEAQQKSASCYAVYDTADIMKRRAIMEKTRVFDPKAQPFVDLAVRNRIKCN